MSRSHFTNEAMSDLMWDDPVAALPGRHGGNQRLILHGRQGLGVSSRNGNNLETPVSATGVLNAARRPGDSGGGNLSTR